MTNIVKSKNENEGPHEGQESTVRPGLSTEHIDGLGCVPLVPVQDEACYTGDEAQRIWENVEPLPSEGDVRNRHNRNPFC